MNIAMKVHVHLLYSCLLIITFFAGRMTVPSSHESPITTPSRGIASIARPMLGSSEIVHLGEAKSLQLSAKVDSGAESASLHAYDITPFYHQKNGRKSLFVKFKTENDSGEKLELIKEVSKEDTVTNANGSAKRFFIKETVWIGSESYETEISLADRKNLKKKFLIGKNLMHQGDFLVDVRQEMMAQAESNSY